MAFVVVPIFLIAPVGLIRYFGIFTQIIFEAIYIYHLPTVTSRPARRLAMLGNLVLDQSLRSRGLRGFTRRGARKRLGSSANLTSMVGSHNLTSNLEHLES